MYDLAMTIYFGLYGATMTTNCPFFWGPDSIMMLPCERGVPFFLRGRGDLRELFDGVGSSRPYAIDAIDRGG